jgi:Spy/CpxP family protein refolding chaperone
MKHTAKLLAIVATSFVFVLSSTLALAQPPQPGPKDDGKGKGPLLHCLMIVNLSADQQTQIRSILVGSQVTLQALREEVREAREAVKAEMEADAVDPCKVGEAVIAVRTAEEALRVEMKNVLDDVKLVLSPEQAAKLEGCLEASRDDFPGRGNPGGN